MVEFFVCRDRFRFFSSQKLYHSNVRIQPFPEVVAGKAEFGRSGAPAIDLSSIPCTAEQWSQARKEKFCVNFTSYSAQRGIMLAMKQQLQKGETDFALPQNRETAKLVQPVVREKNYPPTRGAVGGWALNNWSFHQPWCCGAVEPGGSDCADRARQETDSRQASDLARRKKKKGVSIEHQTGNEVQNAQASDDANTDHSNLKDCSTEFIATCAPFKAAIISRGCFKSKNLLEALRKAGSYSKAVQISLGACVSAKQDITNFSRQSNSSLAQAIQAAASNRRRNQLERGSIMQKDCCFERPNSAFPSELGKA